jgi:hypothetical protein
VDASTFQLLIFGCCYQISTTEVGLSEAAAEVMEAAEAAEVMEAAEAAEVMEAAEAAEAAAEEPNKLLLNTGLIIQKQLPSPTELFYD